MPGRALLRALGLVVCIVTAACSSSSHSAASSGSASRDRLAIVTSQGVMIWSKANGIKRVGPVVRGSDSLDGSQVTWSPDGRYLAWFQDGAGTLVRVDTRTGASMSWDESLGAAAIGFNKGLPVIISGPFLYTFHNNGSTSPTAIMAAPEISASYKDGFIFTDGSGTGNERVRVWRARFRGQTVRAGILPPPGDNAPNGPGDNAPYEQIASMGDGRQIALEAGDHVQDPCAAGLSSRLYLMNTLTGKLTSPKLPVPANTKWRFGDIMFGAGSVLDLSAYHPGACKEGGRFQTLLLELSKGQLRVAARNAIEGQRGPSGQLAVITGDYSFKIVNHEIPELTVVGKQQLKVDGTVMPTPAPPNFISWAPRNP